MDYNGHEKSLFGGELMLGAYSEVSVVQFPDMEEKAEYIINSIHRIAMTEFMSRKIVTMWDWEVRTKHVFENNHIEYVRDVVSLTMGQVNRLTGCGYKTRKEVYDVFTMFHVRLNHWSPEKHWKSGQYTFKKG